MALAWYRKWRPKVFSDVIGQDHVTTTLRRALADQAVSHAYLFCGPRGVGKTTTARLLAKSINCTASRRKAQLFEPCNSCPSCAAFNNEAVIDCFEIDAASNRGIDDIRALKETIQFASTGSLYKVYIVDEVHMLTKEAFNALLKTLEEPPDRVLLILATTEAHKVPETVISRCQRFDFRPIGHQEMVRYLLRISQQESLNLTKEGASILAEAAAGSGRDALSLLQQVSSSSATLNAETIPGLLGFVPQSQAEKLLQLMRFGDQTATLKQIELDLEKGSHPESYVKAMLRALHRGVRGDDVSWRQGLSDETLIKAALEWGNINRYLKSHPEPYLVMATACLGTIKSFKGDESVGKKESKTVHGETLPEQESQKSLPDPKLPAIPVVEQTNPASPSPPQTLEAKTHTATLSHQQIWQQLIAQAKPHNHSLAALLADATLLHLTEDEIMIGVHFPFHKSRLAEIKNRRILEEILSTLTGRKLNLKCSLVASPRSDDGIDDDLVEAVQRVFKVEENNGS